MFASMGVQSKMAPALVQALSILDTALFSPSIVLPSILGSPEQDGPGVGLASQYLRCRPLQSLWWATFYIGEVSLLATR